jgi:2-dehydropantoate 2-reductase
MIDDNAVCRLMTRMMDEAIAVAAASGATVPLTADELLQATRPFGEHKTSMLQDFEVGRPVELDPIVGAVQELGRLNSVPTPTIDTILALARQKAELAGCYSTAP